MKKIVMGVLLLGSAASADTPVFTVESRLLEIPLVELREAGQRVHFEVKFLANQDFSQFTLIHAEPANPAQLKSINLDAVSGEFEGRIASYLPGTTTRQIGPFTPNCSGFPFDTTSASMKFTVSGSKIDFEHDVFSASRCLYTGSIDGDNITGTYQCSDFTTGTWRLNTLRLNSALGDSITAHISLVGNNNCSYDASFIGLRK